MSVFIVFKTEGWMQLLNLYMAKGAFAVLALSRYVPDAPAIFFPEAFGLENAMSFAKTLDGNISCREPVVQNGLIKLEFHAEDRLALIRSFSDGACKWNDRVSV